MNKISIIYSGDIGFQIIKFVDGDREKAKEQAALLDGTGTLKGINVQHYDTIEFDDLIEMNDWILGEVEQDRTHPASLNCDWQKKNK